MHVGTTNNMHLT